MAPGKGIVIGAGDRGERLGIFTRPPRRTARFGGRTPFISAQNHWSLLERQAEAEVVPAARHFGLGVLPFFPLANGLLTGKVRQGQPIPAEPGWPNARVT